MRKQIPCGSVVPGCAFVAHGEGNAEAVRQITEHLRAAHGIDRLSSPVQEKIHRAIEPNEPTRTQA